MQQQTSLAIVVRATTNEVMRFFLVEAALQVKARRDGRVKGERAHDDVSVVVNT